MEKKTYVITSGKHIDSEGKKYVKGDKIELTEDEAKGLVNKIVDPSSFGVAVSASPDEVSALRQRIADLEQENAELKEAVESDD